MKAAIYRSYGPPEVLKIEEVEQPTIEAEHDDRVLIKVHSASVNPYDYLFRKGFLPTRSSNGFFTPKDQILGIDVVGLIDQIHLGGFGTNGPASDIFLVAFNPPTV